MTQTVATISADDAEEYTQALGQVLAGGWRQRALAWRLGVPQALGMTLEQWTHERLGGYVRLNIPDRRDAVRELTTPEADGGQGMSQREAADVLGVAQKTVSRDLERESNDSPASPDGPFDTETDDEPESSDSRTACAADCQCYRHDPRPSTTSPYLTPLELQIEQKLALGWSETRICVELKCTSEEVQAVVAYNEQINSGVNPMRTGRIERPGHEIVVWLPSEFGPAVIEEVFDAVADLVHQRRDVADDVICYARDVPPVVEVKAASPAHGISGYKRGCRCDVCIEANRDRVRRQTKTRSCA